MGTVTTPGDDSLPTTHVGGLLLQHIGEIEGRKSRLYYVAPAPSIPQMRDQAFSDHTSCVPTFSTVEIARPISASVPGSPRAMITQTIIRIRP